ncbi:MAG: phosphotransferase [Myxococcales bacterium]|nr:phosphotransferase [Myxococcales bacterium]
MPLLTPELAAVVERVAAGSRVLEVAPLAADASTRGGTHKGGGYGVPLRITLREARGTVRRIVFHTEKPSDFGHDRRADRAADMLLAFDTFNDVPGQVPALDVGAICADGSLVSLGQSGEFYVVTGWAEGQLYADDLRRVAAERQSGPLDLGRVIALADALAVIHVPLTESRPAVYRRAIRDLVGHGEGIYGIIDSYPSDVQEASPARLRAIEQRAADWRWRLRGKEARLSRTHGDFHPFTVLFDERGNLSLLDASRGCRGDPADDVSCMAVNFLFFALGAPGSWPHGFRPLWHGFWQRALETHAPGLLEVVPPFITWRLLVLSSPVWYPSVEARVRDALLGLCERALEAGRLEPEWAEELFA